VVVPFLGYRISQAYFAGAPLLPVFSGRCSSARGVAKAPLPDALAGPRTSFCNPLDLPYNFQPNKPEYREAADPSMVVYKDTYFLFVSKLGWLLLLAGPRPLDAGGTAGPAAVGLRPHRHGHGRQDVLYGIL